MGTFLNGAVVIVALFLLQIIFASGSFSDVRACIASLLDNDSNMVYPAGGGVCRHDPVCAVLHFRRFSTQCKAMRVLGGANRPA